MSIQRANDPRIVVHPFYNAAQQLLRVSDYARRQQAQLNALLAQDACLDTLSAGDYQNLVSVLPLCSSYDTFSSQLRQFRHRHLLRLLLREMVGVATTEETLCAWSDCADALILHGLAFCSQQVSAAHGMPCDALGNGVFLYCLALGKLGGRELNFSSDVDLIFTFSAAGQTQGVNGLSNQHYFTKVVQLFIRLFQTVTVDGFVFRVDLRLRPNGESGPLVFTLAAFETYYQEQGRDWERYAMVKARLIGAAQPWVHRLIIPFVYRRYVDFSVIESLRGMKAMIDREVRLNPVLNDIKRGQGGIREIEFIIQCFQLIRGGRLPHLQKQSAMDVLRILKQERILQHADVLEQAYWFFRKLENALQTHGDQQTHVLPDDPSIQAHVLLMMGFSCFNTLCDRLHQYQRIVSRAFRAVLGYAHGYENESRLLNNQLMNVWQGHVEVNMAVHLLMSLGIVEAQRCYQIIQAFRHAPKCRRLTQVARLRLDRFMVVLLSEMRRVKNTDVVLLQVLQLLENIVGRSAYLALLTENTAAFRSVLYWFEHSPFITSLLVNQPFLLVVLIDQGHDWRPLSRKKLREQLQSRLQQVHDCESQEEMLREFKLGCWLSVACAELAGRCTAVRAARFLADVADVIMGFVLDYACEQLRERHPDIMRIKSRFSIVAYGTFGGLEMNYDSDLDLVFLHRASLADEGLVTRLTQKILHMLTIRTRAGVLYSVDTRLRPSGSAGLLVSHFDAFVVYQSAEAWTWEHQALVRARVVFGGRAIRQKFLQLKQNVLIARRKPEVLIDEVKAMRLKMSKYFLPDTVKYMAGGLLDLEFLIQFLVLRYPNPLFAQTARPQVHLLQLFEQGVLTRVQYRLLRGAYVYYHRLLHHQFLTRQVLEDATKYSSEVLGIRDHMYACVK